MKFSPKILNVALDLSMEFGENWLRSIEERLSKFYPELSFEELAQCDKICKEVNRTGNKFVYDNPVRDGDEVSFVAFSLFEKSMLLRYDWITDKNLKKLYSQSCYYAMK